MESMRTSGADERAARPSASDEARRSPRSLRVPDPLYGTIRVSGWAATLLATPPFRRLAGVSLSDVPGELLFRRPFPSRLDHTLGVYHLTRLARPRDRTLQAAALFHDLGHGPFSHLTEPLMRERLGVDHEERSARLLTEVRDALTATAQRQLAWLDWDEVARLMDGSDADGRGVLLNGLLDYDNCDNVARFLQASGLGRPGYDPEALARGLRLVGGAESVGLHATAESEALGWSADRARVYGYLHEGHPNLAAHSMLRKAVDLAAASNILPADFFDLTDADALAVFARALDRGLVGLATRVRAGADHLHRCVWEAELPAESPGMPDSWRERLALEARLAAEAGLAPADVVVEALISKAARPLPPVVRASRSGPIEVMPAPAPPVSSPLPYVLHVFVSRDAGADYARRLRMAATRHYTPLGARELAAPAGE